VQARDEPGGGGDGHGGIGAGGAGFGRGFVARIALFAATTTSHKHSNRAETNYKNFKRRPMSH
jgi:hypothetical protein